jgi:hypothetical protein
MEIRNNRVDERDSLQKAKDILEQKNPEILKGSSDYAK